MAWKKYVFYENFHEYQQAAFPYLHNQACLSNSMSIDYKFELQVMEIREAVEEAAETQTLHQIQAKV